MQPVTITAENFQSEVLESDVPVLLDFWAAWCGPCRMVAPVLDDIAAAYDGRLKVGKVDVESQPDLAAAFQVSGIPMLALVEDEQVVAVKVGAGSRGQIESALGLDRLAEGSRS